ncbi:MAG: hypothetical protein HQL10_06985 [Nitrospirae bacterium]|nr:hypothetical protein [Nitrospirota bacterium]
MSILKYLCLLMIALFMIAACTKDKNDKQDAPKSIHSNVAETSTPGISAAIKNQKWPNSQSTTIGTVFDSYKHLTKKEWRESSLKSGHYTIDFSGWFEKNTLNDKDIQDGVIDRGVGVTFVIEPNGAWYVLMVSKLEVKSDGKLYRYEQKDSTAILDKIYANKKISF